MTFKNLTAGLTILAKYCPQGLDTEFGGAEHDVVAVCPPGKAQGITGTDLKALLGDLGFHYDGNERGWYFFT